MNPDVAQIYADIKELTKCCLTENKKLIEKKILQDHDCDINFLVLRNDFVSKYSWAIPTHEIIKEMVGFIKNDVTIEIGCGTALWTYLLKKEGCQIIPVDLISSANCFTNIIQGDAISSINKFAADVLILIWPPYNNSMAHDSLKDFGGDRVIYIGESFYGCTADDKFHELLEKKWQLVKKSYIPTWPCVNDFVMFYKKKT